MFAAIFLWEIHRAIRRPWFRNLRLSYLAFFSILFLFQLASVQSIAANVRNLDPYDVAVRGDFLKAVHFFALLAFAPMLAVGPISQEKKLKTLDLLLTTQIQSVDLIIGKWLAACTEMLVLLLPSLPYFLWSQGFIAEPWWAIASWFACSLIFVLPFTATPILAAVLLRRQWSALVVGFAGNMGWFALALGVFTDAQLGMWPYAVYDGNFWLTFLAIITVPTAFMLSLAIWRLRAANESDQNAIESRSMRPRPPVADEAIYWKQRFANETQIPWMIGMLRHEFRVAAFGVLCSGLALVSSPIGYYTPMIGVAILLQFPVVTLVLAGTTVSAERDGGTWDALRLAVTASDYVDQTIRGVKARVWPYWFALAPAIIILCIRDIGGGIAIAVSWMFAGMEIHYCAIGGVYASVRAKSSWTSVLRGLTGFMVRTVAATLLGFAGSVIAFVLFSIVCCSLIGSLNRFGDMVIIAGATIGLIIFSLLYHSFCLSTTNLHFVKSVETLVSDDGLER